MKRYDSYKDSGVEWIVDTPSGWSQTKMKYVGDYINGYPFKPSDWGDTGRLIIRIQNLTKGRGSENFYDGEIDSKYIIKTGDYLFSWSTTLGLFEWKREEGVLNQHIFKVELNDILTRKFYYWVIQGVIKELSNESHGSTMTHLTKDVFGNIRLPLPPLSEQHQIVSYLDTTTSLIDSLIEKTQRKIELLKEKRTSLINKVVTKGLNPNVEMKDSGMEWIGEIPSGWEIKRVKHLIEDDGGIKIGPFGSSLKLDTLTDDGIKVYGQGNVIKDDFTIGHRHIPIERFESDFSQYEIFEGDILITMMGTTGKSKVFKKEFKRGILDSHLLRLRFKKESFISDLFVTVLQESDYVFHQLRLNSKGSIMEGLNSSIVKELVLMTPPLLEQQQIVPYLDEQTSKIDSSIQMEERKIELLKEYRQSLISSVVTGKIDVRTN